MVIRTAKEEHELAVFLDFARVAGLSVDRESQTSGGTNKPDIRCTIDGATHYFELARLLDQRAAKMELARRRGKVIRGEDWNHRIRVPERVVLQAKLAKSYDTGEDPVDLVLYYDWGPLADGPQSMPPPFGLTPSFVDSVIRPVLSTGMGPYCRVYFYDRPTQAMLLEFPED